MADNKIENSTNDRPGREEQRKKRKFDERETTSLENVKFVKVLLNDVSTKTIFLQGNK